MINHYNSKKHSKKLNFIDYDIDYHNNIICLFKNCIKILPEITNKQIQSINNKILKIDPIIEYIDYTYNNKIICWYDENDKINKNKFIVYGKLGFNIYKYDLINKKIFIFYSYENSNEEIQLIKYNSEKALIIMEKNRLSLFDLSKFEKIWKSKSLESLTIKIFQINNDELIIIIDDIFNSN